jgi:hypothetical protein
MPVPRLLLVLQVVGLFTVQGFAGGPFGAPWPLDPASVDHFSTAPSSPLDEPRKENTRLVSSGLAVLLGPFGAHRLYLGTTPKVAVIYGVTFGGFGLLPLIDLGHLLFTKDLGPYQDNDRVFMWGKAAKPTPP